jgi:hypothetical protein
MKNLCTILLLFILIFSSKGYTQDATYGFKGGIAAIIAGAEITEVGDEEQVFTHEVKFTGASPSYQAGFFFNKKFNSIFFQSDLLYNHYSMNYLVRSSIYTDIPNEEVGENFHYIDFGLRAGLTANGFSLGWGPTWHRLVGYSAALSFIPRYNDKPRKNSYGFVGFLMYEYEQLVVEIKYENTFRTIGDHIYYGNSKSKFRETPDQLSILFGWAF